MEVTLLSHTDDPLRSLYLAYRTCYSASTPQEITTSIEDESIPREKMERFIADRLRTGHSSPLEQVWFEFAISGVSRAFSHQFVRHRVGISFEQQSQRYVNYRDGDFPYEVPKSVERAGMGDALREHFSGSGALYEKMIEADVPPEDARFVLPNAASTNFKITVNFASLLHICDQRLCTRAQWEFRRVAALMRAEVLRVEPELGRHLQPKCGELRTGYCDESRKDWEACSIGRVRPHKEALFRLYNQYRSGDLQPLRGEDWSMINGERGGVGDDNPASQSFP